jgi:hypothetical protein
MVVLTPGADPTTTRIATLGARSAQRAHSVLRSLEAFCDSHGIEARHGFDPDVIEAFCRGGLVGRTSTTRGTYRSVLRILGDAGDGGRRRQGRPYPGAKAPVPYTAAERAELWAIAAAQRPGRMRASALAMVAAGLGAGLSALELVALCGADVERRRGDVVVDVNGSRRRSVPVAAPYDAVLDRLARQAGNRVLFRPGLTDRAYKNAVNDLARHLVADPATPRFRMGRARASFVCGHLAAGTPLSELLAISGLVEVESLARYAAHVDAVPASKAGLRERLAGERHQ